MTIKTNAEGKVIVTVSADVEMDGACIVRLSSEMPFDEETKEPQPEEGVVYVDNIPDRKEGYDLYFDGDVFTQRENPNYAKELEKHNLKEELRVIQKWFYANDWHCNKITCGDWTETTEDWLNYKAERNEKRARQDEIFALLGIPKAEQEAFLAMLGGT